MKTKFLKETLVFCILSQFVKGAQYSIKDIENDAPELEANSEYTPKTVFVTLPSMTVTTTITIISTLTHSDFYETDFGNSRDFTSDCETYFNSSDPSMTYSDRIIHYSSDAAVPKTSFKHNKKIIPDSTTALHTITEIENTNSMSKTFGHNEESTYRSASSKRIDTNHESSDYLSTKLTDEDRDLTTHSFKSQYTDGDESSTSYSTNLSEITNPPSWSFRIETEDQMTAPNQYNGKTRDNWEETIHSSDFNPITSVSIVTSSLAMESATEEFTTQNSVSMQTAPYKIAPTGVSNKDLPDLSKAHNGTGNSTLVPIRNHWSSKNDTHEEKSSTENHENENKTTTHQNAVEKNGSKSNSNLLSRAITILIIAHVINMSECLLSL